MCRFILKGLVQDLLFLLLKDGLSLSRVSGVPLCSPLSVSWVCMVCSLHPRMMDPRVKRTYHADPKNTEWTAQRDPADPQETKTILKKKEKKIPDEPLQDEAAQSTPAAWPHQRDFEFNFRFNSGQCFHLMDTFLCRFPQHLQLLCMWGYASVSDG